MNRSAQESLRHGYLILIVGSFCTNSTHTLYNCPNPRSVQSQVFPVNVWGDVSTFLELLAVLRTTKVLLVYKKICIPIVFTCTKIFLRE